MVNSMKKRHLTKEHKIKIGKANKISLKGKHCSPSTEFKKGHKLNRGKNNGNWKDGISLVKKYCVCGKKIIWTSKRCHSCTMKGKNNPNWLNGISKEGYSYLFNLELKESIRKRDNYKCQLCHKKAKHVHHIDYDKTNCKEKNLIILCHKCNIKVNYNRDCWYLYFTYIIKSKEK